jgi:hypothetical protein
LRRRKASDVAKGCEHTERNDRIDAANRHQSFHSFVIESVFGEALFVSSQARQRCDRVHQDGDQ